VTGIGALEILKLGVYYASYLYFIAAPLLLWLLLRRRGRIRLFVGAFLAVITILAYARFVEPRFLLTAEHEIVFPGCFENTGALRIAVFSDTHNGIFGNAMPIDRIVRRVNAASPDIVLVPGDYVYFLHPDRFEETFAAFAQIKAPVFAVLGNHDLGLPGPNLGAPLNQSLRAMGVHMIDDRALKLSNSRFAIELVGLSDQWARDQKLSLLENPVTAPRITLTHNPATMRDLTPAMSASLLVGGHTHGGQIMLPFITCWWTGMCGDIAYGLRTEKNTLVFTTSGTGMVGLPMRFRVPPRVDVLNVRYEMCGA